MTDILFVDDEPRVLSGLRAALWRRRNEWRMVFAASGEEAVELLAQRPWDVIVADIRMPGVGGVELLEIARERFPGVVRIVLSGQTDLDSVHRIVNCAQQVLAKPCGGEEIQRVLERALWLRGLLTDDGLRALVGGVGQLPSLPRAYRELTDLIADPETPLTRVARAVEDDAALCAKVMQLVNSAFFGLPSEITSVARAVSYLGTSTLRTIVLGIEVFQGFGPASPVAGFDLDGLQRRAGMTARLARDILPAGDPAAKDQAFLAGMLHDIGLIIMATRLPDRLGAILAEASGQGVPLHALEARTMGGVGHAEVGAYLLGLWGLPAQVVEAVAFHHAPRLARRPEFDLVGAVHVADALVAGDPSLVDLEYLDSVGVRADLPGWTALAESEVGAPA